MRVRKIWAKNFYISPMKLIRLLKALSENETLKYDLCSIATVIIAAAVIMGILNFFIL